MSIPKSQSTKPASHLVTLWVPIPLVEVIAKAAKRKDTDRSKWIREAMREKAQRDLRA